MGMGLEFKKNKAMRMGFRAWGVEILSYLGWETGIRIPPSLALHHDYHYGT